jgi:hypothetical protein
MVVANALGQRGSKCAAAAPWKSPLMAGSTVCDDYFRVADDPPAIHKRYGASAELFSYRLLAGRESDRRCVRHADCRQKKVLKPTCLGAR